MKLSLAFFKCFDYISCVNGMITEISMSWTDADLEGCISQKALNFANQRAKEMGMSASW